MEADTTLGVVGLEAFYWQPTWCRQAIIDAGHIGPGRIRLMKVIHCQQVPATPVTTEGASGCSLRCLIGPDDNAPCFTMRQFEIAPGGNTPYHPPRARARGIRPGGQRPAADRRGRIPLATGHGGAGAAPNSRISSSTRAGGAAAVSVPDSASPARGVTADSCLVSCGCE